MLCFARSNRLQNHKHQCFRKKYWRNFKIEKILLIFKKYQSENKGEYSEKIQKNKKIFLKLAYLLSRYANFVQNL